jgi:hypothetical protein
VIVKRTILVTTARNQSEAISFVLEQSYHEGDMSQKDADVSLLDRNTTWTLRYIPTFQGNILSPSSGLNIFSMFL